MSWSATWLRDARKAKGLSQADIGATVGAAQAQVSQWETGKATPPADVIAKLDKLFGKATPKAGAEQLTIGAAPDPAPVIAAPKGKSARPAKSASDVGGGDLGFETKLWFAADKLRANLDAAEEELTWQIST